MVNYWTNGINAVITAMLGGEVQYLGVIDSTET
jgi:hypothetical protein